jgi:cytochrome d ubiquinol oxidase subunit II
MNELHFFLTTVWFLLLGSSIALYVALDGFGLGIGILALFVYEPERRRYMITSLQDNWHGNEMWLLVALLTLLGAFPLAFERILRTIPFPAAMLLASLLLRRIALFYLHHTHHPRGWLILSGVASLLITLTQGWMLGSILAGLPLAGYDQNAGLLLALTVTGLISGYILLGSTYLLGRGRAHFSWVSRLAKYAVIISLLALAGVLAELVSLHTGIAERWKQPAELTLLSGIIIAGAVLL